MLMKLSLILFLAMSALGMEPVTVNTSNVFKWGTGVEAPLCYSSKIITGEHGVYIKGVQYIPKGGKVRYEIVKRGFWEDKVFDKIEIHHDGKFSAKLSAPKNEYHIKICGYEMAHGTLKISPY
jgi:hypothetical protein